MVGQNPEISILISSYKRLEYFKRTLFNLVKWGPKRPWELIISDEESDQTKDLLKEVQRYQDSIKYKFIIIDNTKFEKTHKVKKFFNNSALTNSIGWKNCQGKYIILQGNDIIVTRNIYDELVDLWESRGFDYGVFFTSTYNIAPCFVQKLGEFGDEIGPNILKSALLFPLQTKILKCLVNNYVSLSTKKTWDLLEGSDLNYLAGIACEDSDWTNRASFIPNSIVEYTDIECYHQDHGNMTHYNKPKESIISEERWEEGVRINRAYYYPKMETKSYKNGWPLGDGDYVKKIVTNY